MTPTIEAKELVNPQITAIICSPNGTLKSVLRDGAKLAGVFSTMILDKTSEAVQELKNQPQAWLLVDYQTAPEELAKILTAAQGANAYTTRPIYLIAQEFLQSMVALALEFNISKLKFGGITTSSIETDLKMLSSEVASRVPIATALSKIQVLVISKNIKEADSLFKSLLATSPSNINVVSEYIDFLISANELKSAKDQLEKIQILEPKDIRILHLQARYYMRTKNYPEGIRILESLERTNPWSAPRLIEFGEALLSTSRFTEARERFDRAIQIDPENEEAISGQAKSALLNGQIQEGFERLRELGSPRQMASTLNTAAVCAARSERIAEARHLYEKGIQLLVNDLNSSARLWYNLGILERRAKNLDRSLTCFKNSIGTDPTFKDAQHNFDIIRQMIASGFDGSQENPAKRRKVKHTLRVGNSDESPYPLSHPWNCRFYEHLINCLQKLAVE